MSDQESRNIQQSASPVPPHRHESDHGNRGRVRSVLWGITLVVLGTIFLVDKLDIFETIDLLHEWWPLILIAFGIYSGGHILTGIGVWLLIGALEPFGLTYSTSWPVILIVVGASMVLRTLFDRREQRADDRELVEERR